MNDKPIKEMMFNIYCGEWRYEVGPDNDGLGGIEIRYYELGEHKSDRRLMFSREEAVLIGQALLDLVNN